MKRLTLLLILGLMPYGANAVRTGPGTCEPGTSVPSGYCCISYNDPYYKEALWNCDNLRLSASAKAQCKSGNDQCINFCYEYDLDNDTCAGAGCIGNTVTHITDSEDCTIPNATLCDYDWVCPKCGGTCHRENEQVFECTDEHWYTNSDFTQCHKCPGNGVIDWDMGNDGIVTCYIPRTTMTGTDTTGAFKYVNDKCYYKE